MNGEESPLGGEELPLLFEVLLHHLLDALEEAHHAGARQTVDGVLAVPALVDDAGLLQDAQMLRYRRLVAADDLLELADTELTALVSDIDHQKAAWVRQRFQERGMNPDNEVVEYVCQNVEGNLLAAAQEIDKISYIPSCDS